jgi:UDP-N-acetyl-2-amino-2-deoxyglucuronate dehydrogenase
VWAVSGTEQVLSPLGAGLRPDPPLSTINAALAPFHALQIADFLAAVRTGGTPAVTGREAMASLAIVTAIYASAAAGRPEPVSAGTYAQELRT